MRCPLPPNTLPALRELRVTTELIIQFVPGRLVETIEVSTSQGIYQDWPGEEVGSAARIRTKVPSTPRCYHYYRQHDDGGANDGDSSVPGKTMVVRIR